MDKDEDEDEDEDVDKDEDEDEDEEEDVDKDEDKEGDEDEEEEGGIIKSGIKIRDQRGKESMEEIDDEGGWMYRWRMDGGGTEGRWSKMRQTRKDKDRRG